MTRRLIVATGNRGKLAELAAMITGYELLCQTDLNIAPAEETGGTFVENAILKARHAAACANLPALADDSGLEVDALGGAPGIYSARFAGAEASDQENCVHLLQSLSTQDSRRARFRCVLVVMRHANDAAPLICQGTWEGAIARAPAGDHGFGYDPLFVPAGLDCTSAQLPAAEKNRISHRGIALAKLIEGLPAFLATT